MIRPRRMPGQTVVVMSVMAAAQRLLARLACALAVCAASSGVSWAVHYDIELRTSGGPVAGSRITTDFFGDLGGLAGQLPIDAATGYQIYPGYFGDLEGGPYLTDDPGFQAFANTFVRGEEIHFRAVGRLQYWNPATGRWGLAPEGVEVTLYGGIPTHIVIGYVQDPQAWEEEYAYYEQGTRYSRQGITGPPAAVIDDAKSNGSFHAHLDWKVSSSQGVPPAGAYMVTLSLWSPTLDGATGRPKYLSSQPVHVLFERGISEQQLRQALSARIQPAVPPGGTSPTARLPRPHWAPPSPLPWAVP